MDTVVLLQTCDCEDSYGEPNANSDIACVYCGALYVEESAKRIDAEVEQLSIIIKAAENWSPQYRKNKDIFKKLLQTEARLERLLRGYYRDFATRSDSYVNWLAYDTYLRSIQAADSFDIDVLIEDGPLGQEDGFFVQVVYQPLEDAVAFGALAGEIMTGKDIGVSRTTEFVQQTAKEQSAYLVGKRVDQNGVIVDNSRAKYRITDTVRKDIRQAIGKSLSLGETVDEARKRVQESIKNPKRAELIAQTEVVNAYNGGLLSMGKETGAVGKEWQSVNPDDVCGTNARQGVIAINKSFASGNNAPAAHPRCRCSMRLIYPEDPSAKQLAQPTSPGEDMDTVYHGDGANLSNGNYTFGDTFYVSRSKTTAGKFGKVRELNITIPKEAILLIDNNRAYADLIAQALRAYPGVNLNQALPKHVAALGYKAVEMSPDIDPLGGIAIVDSKLIPN